MPSIASAKDKGWIIGKPEKGYYEIRFSPDFRSNIYTLEELFESNGGQRLTNLYTAIKIRIKNTNKIGITFKPISNNTRFVGVSKGQWIVHAPKDESELIDFALSIYELELDYNGNMKNLEKTPKATIEEIRESAKK